MVLGEERMRREIMLDGHEIKHIVERKLHTDAVQVRELREQLAERGSGQQVAATNFEPYGANIRV